jgi:hypothetical protein
MMPSKTKAQHNFMAAVANNPAFAKKAGVPQSVGKEFSNADKGRKFSKGGDMKHSDVKMDKAMIKKAVGKHAAMPASKAHAGLKSGGMAKGYASGGMPMAMKDGKKVPAFAADGVGKMKSGGMATKMGAVKTSPGNINGIAMKGKTKGTMVKMARGGKAC